MHDLSMLQPAKEFAQHDWDRSFHRVTNLLSSQSAQNALEWMGSLRTPLGTTSLLLNPR